MYRNNNLPPSPAYDMAPSPWVSAETPFTGAGAGANREATTEHGPRRPGALRELGARAVAVVAGVYNRLRGSEQSTAQPQMSMGTQQETGWGAPQGWEAFAQTSVAPNPSENFFGQQNNFAQQPTAEMGLQHEQREGVLGKVRRGLGSLAAREGLGDTFGAGGSVSRGIDRTQAGLSRANEINTAIQDNRLASKALDYIPGGKYVKAAGNVIQTVSAAADLVQARYDTTANGIGAMYNNRGELMMQASRGARAAGGEIIRAGIDAAKDRAKEYAGYDPEKERFRARRVGAAVVRACIPGSGFFAEGASVTLRAGVEGARDKAVEIARGAPGQIMRATEQYMQPSTGGWGDVAPSAADPFLGGGVQQNFNQAPFISGAYPPQPSYNQAPRGERNPFDLAA